MNRRIEASHNYHRLSSPEWRSGGIFNANNDNDIHLLCVGLKRERSKSSSLEEESEGIKGMHKHKRIIASHIE
jgi:hypothetical protein